MDPPGRNPGAVDDFTLGAHAPALADADVDLIHNLWLDASKRGGVEDLHHREIATVALARLAEELKGPARQETLERIRRQLGKRYREAPQRGPAADKPPGNPAPPA